MVPIFDDRIWRSEVLLISDLIYRKPTEPDIFQGFKFYLHLEERKDRHLAVTFVRICYIQATAFLFSDGNRLHVIVHRCKQKSSCSHLLFFAHMNNFVQPDRLITFGLNLPAA